MMDERKGMGELPELGSLPREAPPALEERVVQALRRKGLLAAPMRSSWRRSFLLVDATAAVTIFLAGFLAGSGRRPTAPADFEPTFALLLHSGPGYQRPEGEQHQRQRVEEYRAWARGLYAQGLGIRGEKLSYDGRLLQQEAEVILPSEDWARDPGPLGGFFLINARTLDDALRIARTCPHLRHGGTIEVRPVDPT